MMGVSHGIHGAAFGAATLPVAPAHTPAGQLAWVAVWAGMALGPDADSGGVAFTSRPPFVRLHGSTVARMWGPFSAVPAEAIAKVAGGHRNGTHSLAGVATATLVAFLASLHPVGQLILVAAAVGLALRAFAWVIPGATEKQWPVNMLLSFAAAYTLTEGGLPVHELVPFLEPVTLTPPDLTWLPLAVAGGWSTHIVGDMLTPERCPLLWPLDKRRFGIGLFTTGRRAGLEVVLVVVLAAATVWFCYLAGLLGPLVGASEWVAGSEQVAAPGLVVVLAAVAGVLAWREYQSATSH